MRYWLLKACVVAARPVDRVLWRLALAYATEVGRRHQAALEAEGAPVA